ncbi:PLDc N-terminal domain-containing protein [Cellulomonas sp. S1-8]|uniref:PLDc N-terminal domain-containing protein n=1 Tax=Cellulomonas sp. S1-8 TaxID=2904790 RepID=UPI002244295A|nr:PLDc N-terminal domain-containing protein [Cellulomonas sp. S1-8]UZN03183.1 PLDc N-terminal domain-containing protein [Cellulomonas sp. S1-8]
MDVVDSLWDWFLVMVFWFLFFAYLLILWQIVTDLFRDRELSGWGKAVWLVFLILFPFLTALVYTVARGRGMSERQISAVHQAKADTDAYIRHVAAASPAEQISGARALLDAGTITADEYAVLKAKALA